MRNNSTETRMYLIGIIQHYTTAWLREHCDTKGLCSIHARGLSNEGTMATSFLQMLSAKLYYNCTVYTLITDNIIANLFCKKVADF